MKQDRRDQATINFEVYQGKTNFLGIASVTLPNASFLTQTMSGSGISGNVEAVLRGQMDAMSLTLNWRNLTQESAALATPERHDIELRAALQVEDPVKRTIEVRAVKHVFVVIPKTMTGGNIAPASTGDAGSEYAVRYWAYYIDGKKQMELDPFNSICYINGKDWLQPVRKALGH